MGGPFDRYKDCLAKFCGGLVRASGAVGELSWQPGHPSLHCDELSPCF